MLSGMIQLSVCTFYYIVVDTVSQSRSLMDVYVIGRLEEVEDNLRFFLSPVLINLFLLNEFFSSVYLTLMPSKEKSRYAFPDEHYRLCSDSILLKVDDQH